ncbi:MAG: DNA-binding protein [Lachnospiraceae bacterium]|nr:DNA-binding protein [Lachnospiraceae bacterium]MBQ9122100.1 DNA-binding protein [Lachnospiraceae bacterium]
MENIFQQNMLYDFYGELLTEHQKKIYEAAVFEDMSLSEIGAEFGISRQGVHDLIKRCDKILRDYEDKLHLLQRFEETKKTANLIHELSLEAKDAMDVAQSKAKILEIEKLSVKLIEEL